MSGRLWNLRTKLVLTLVALTSAAALVSASLFYSALVDQLDETLGQSLARETRTQALALHSELHLLSVYARQIALAPTVQALRRAGGAPDHPSARQVAALFTNVLAAEPQYRQLRYVSVADGVRELVRADRLGTGGAIRVVGQRDAPAAGVTGAGAGRYEEAETGSVRLALVPPDRDAGPRAAPSGPVMRASAPVLGEDDRVFGTVTIDVSMTGVFESLEALVPPDRRTFVANSDGELVWPPASAGAALPAGATAAPLPPRPPSAADDGFAIARHERLEGREVIVGTRRVEILPDAPDTALGLALVTDRARLSAYAFDTFRDAALLILAGIALIALLGVAVAGGLVRPLRSVAAAIRTVDAYDDAPIPVPATPEAAQIAMAFNEAQARNVHARHLVERANRDLEQFAYLASHDLQEPARTMRSFAELLEERYADAIDETGRKSLRFIVDSAIRMQALISDLLQHSRLGRGTDLAPVDLDEVVAGVVDALAPAIESSGATVTRGALPTVLADPEEMRVLFENLLSNAVKFRAADRALHIAVSARTSHEHHRIVVEDNGIGVAPAARDRVFQIFQRAQRRDDYEGTGVGLAHCRKIVESLGGRIHIEAPARDGTRVVIDLPTRIVRAIDRDARS